MFIKIKKVNIMNKVKKNAVIMAAGTSSRFAPLSYELPKGLLKVKGEVLIERQIKQLKEAGIDEIIIVVGYKKEMFTYLKDMYGVILIENNLFDTRNNNASIFVAKDYIKNTLICSADNYFSKNPFMVESSDAYYSCVYSDAYINEWCLHTDQDGTIDDVVIGGSKAWYMLGPAYFNEAFSTSFLKILEQEYFLEETKGKLWESIYIDHLDELKMKIMKFKDDVIFEFDTLDELREFDSSYKTNAHSKILDQICNQLACRQEQLSNFVTMKDKGFTAVGFHFDLKGETYTYMYQNQTIGKVA